MRVVEDGPDRHRERRFAVLATVPVLCWRAVRRSAVRALRDALPAGSFHVLDAGFLRRELLEDSYNVHDFTASVRGESLMDKTISPRAGREIKILN